MKTLRSTLVQDLHVTISRIIQIAEHKLLEKNSKDEMMAFAGLVNQLINVLQSTKYEKTFCSDCPGSVGAHQVEETLSIAIKLFQKALDANSADEKMGNDFGKLYCMKMKNLTSLECAKAPRLQTNALVMLNSIVSSAKNEQIQLVAPVLLYLFRSISSIKITKTAVQFNEIYLLRKYFDLLSKTQNHRDLIRVGYLALAYHVSANDADANQLHQIIYAVCKVQKEQSHSNTYRSPYNYFSDKKETFLQLKLPDNIDLAEVMLAYVRLGTKYITFPKDIEEIIIDDFLKMSETKDHLHRLRFSLFFTNYDYDKFSGRIENLLKSFQPKGGNDEIAATVVEGSLALAKYLNEKEKISKKYKDLKISSKFELSMPALSELNFEYERRTSELLLKAKNSHQRFADCYAKCDADRRSALGDEARSVLRNFRLIARYLEINAYDLDAMELYGSSYDFAKAMNDNFAIICCCSYFAEHSAELDKGFRANGWNIGEMLEDCYRLVAKELESLDTLSMRKETEILLCLLSISLHYLSIGETEQAKQMMIFVNQSIEQGISKGKGHLEVVRMKYYFVIFKMITKYDLPCKFSAVKYVDFMIVHLKKKVFTANEDLIMKPLLLFEVIFEFVEFSLNRYNRIAKLTSLLTTVIKFVLRLGHVRRLTQTILKLALCQVYREDVEMSQVRLLDR